MLKVPFLEAATSRLVCTNRRVAWALVVLLAAYPLHAMAQQVFEIRSSAERFEPNTPFLNNCALTKYTLRDLTNATPTEQEFSRLEWTGGCKENRLNGEGVLVVTGVFPAGKVARTSRWEGTWVNGRPTGLMHLSIKLDDGEGQQRLQRVLVDQWFFSKLEEPGLYNRLPNGDFQIQRSPQRGVFEPDPAYLPIPARRFLNLSAQSVAAARGEPAAAGSPSTVKVSQSLIDLMPGGKVVYADDQHIKDIGSKTAAIIISSQTEGELNRHRELMASLKRALAAAKPMSARQQKTADLYLQTFDTGALLALIPKALEKSFAKVEVANDLAEFQARKLDYALIVDISLSNGGPRGSVSAQVLDKRLRYVGALQGYFSLGVQRTRGEWTQEDLAAIPLILKAQEIFSSERFLVESLAASVKQLAVP